MGVREEGSFIFAIEIFKAFEEIVESNIIQSDVEY